MTDITNQLATDSGKLKGAASLLAVTAVFGLGNVVQKALMTEMDGWMALGLRSVLALMCLAPWAASELRIVWLRRRELFKLLPLVMIGFAVGISLQAVGAGLTTATNLGFLINLSVVFTPLLCWLMGQQKLDIVTVMACGVSLAGAALLSQGSPANLGLGDLLCVGAAFGFAIWIMAVQKAATALQCPTLITFVQWLLPLIIGFTMTEQSVGVVTTMSSAAWIELAFLGVGASGMAYLVAADAQSKLSSITAALIYPAEAVFGAIAAFFWLGETMSGLAIFGACITLASIAIVSLPQGSIRITSMKWSAA
jgi:drug/metabolite transporter (DMT)-like permease